MPLSQQERSGCPVELLALNGVWLPGLLGGKAGRLPLQQDLSYPPPLTLVPLSATATTTSASTSSTTTASCL